MNEFNRQGFLGNDFEKSLHDRIGIIGISGGGSHIVQQLVHMGFCNLAFVDFDNLERTNMTRMVLARESDIGKLKAEIALLRSNEVNPNNSNIAIPKRWQEATQVLRECKVIFTCVDRLDEREQLEMFCRKHNIIMIDIGMNILQVENTKYAIYGQVFLSLPTKPCMKCFDFFNPKNKPNGEYGDAGPRSQVVFTNGILASNAINSFVKLISLSYGHCKPSLYKTYDSQADDFIRHPLIETVEKKGCSHY